ncbi:MAG: hypothetical protein COA49_08670 [Bacteroidetes bacterium]|nr:MAG: hypothetical protein COA49_08670 [Bacteroidota bacterium]
MHTPDIHGMIKGPFKNPFFVAVALIAVIAVGLVVVPKMQVDILPAFRKSAMQILTLYPGMPTEVVEKDITSRMERWTGQSNGILKQESKSLMGVSIVTNHYRSDIDPAEAMANTSAYAMSDMYYQPPGTLPPMVQPFDPTASTPLMLLTASSDVKSGKELYDVAYYALRQMLSGVKGIIAPAAYGGSKRRIHIYVDPVMLEAYNLSQTQVNEAIKRNTTMIPSGIAEIGNINYSIDAQGMIKDVEDFNDIVVAMVDGRAIQVKDIGFAADAAAIQTNIVRVDGKNQVYLPIFKRSGSNTIEAVEAVRAAIPKLKERLPDDVQLNVIFDQSSYVRRSISGLMFAGLGGLVLVALILLLFLGNVRFASIAVFAIPLSVLAALVALHGLGQGLNSITLGGIALALGLLVDNAIVMLEDIDRRMKLGLDSMSAAKESAISMAGPVLASTLAIVAVFVPILFFEGIARDLFGPLALTVTACMFASYIFSVAVVPLAAGLFLRNKPVSSKEKKQSGFNNALTRLEVRYENSLKKMVVRPMFLGVIMVALTLMAGFGVTQTGYELFPKEDVGQLEIQVRMPSGTTLSSSENTIAQMEEVVRNELGADLNLVISNIGVFYDLPAAYTPNSGTQDAFIGVQIVDDASISTFEYASRLRKRFLDKFPGVELSFYTGGLMTAALNEGKPAPIDVRIKGNKLEVLRDIAEQVRDSIRGIDGVMDARVLQRLDQPTKEVDIDRERAARMGVDPVDAIKNMVAAFSSTATFDKSFWIDEGNGNHYYVGVTYPEYAIDDNDVLGSVLVKNSLGGKPVPFRNFSVVRDRNTAVEINHHDLSRVFNVYANIVGRDVGRASSEIEERIMSIRENLPRGYSMDLDGEVSVMRSSFANLGLGLGLALLFAYLIVVPLFRSFKQPIGMLLAFPPALAGVVGLLWATGTALSIQALMGAIMVVGITVSYGNLLVDRINKLRAEGMPLEEALTQGARQRLRPIIMTALTTILGLLPTALGMGGSSINEPLALAVIGGTTMAAILTLYVVPTGYRLFSKD